MSAATCASAGTRRTDAASPAAGVPVPRVGRARTPRRRQRRQALRLVAQRVEAVFGHEVQPAVSGGEAAPQLDLPAVGRGQRVPVQHLEPIGERLQDRDVAVHLGRVDLAVRDQRRRASDGAEVRLEEELARLGIQRAEVRRVVHHVQPPGVEDGGRESGQHGIGVPDPRRGRDVAAAGAVEGHDLAQEVAVHGLAVGGGVDGVADDGDRAVERLLAHAELPLQLARRRPQRVDPAVRAAADDQPPPADLGHHGVGLVVEVLHHGVARGGDPQDGAGALVEGDVPLAERGQVPPSGPHHADDQLPSVHQRGMGAPSVSGAAPHLLAQAPLPDRLAVPIQGEQVPVAVLRVEEARLGIRGHARPSHAGEGDGRVVDREPALPELAAVLRVPAPHDFEAKVGASARAHPALEHHRRGAADPVGVPEHVLAAAGPPRRQARLFGNVVGPRAPPGGPLFGPEGTRQAGQQGQQGKGRAGVVSCQT